MFAENDPQLAFISTMLFLINVVLTIGIIAICSALTDIASAMKRNPSEKEDGSPELPE